MVRLKVEQFPESTKAVYCFNSLMVRLKAVGRIWKRRRHIGFNSLMVRLKGSAIFSGTLVQISFNSLMVRLKVQYLAILPLFENVSIP